VTRGPVSGALEIPRALGLLRRERSLWVWCVLPLALNLIFFVAAVAVFVAYYDPLTEGIRAFLATQDPQAWYEWLWVGPLRLLGWLVQWMLVIAVALVVYLLFTVVGSVIASPFLDVLSQRVEQLKTGAVRATDTGALRVAVRVALEDLKRTAFFLVGQLAILALGLVPGLQPLAALLAFTFAALFLSLDYTAYTLDRREVPFGARRSWLWEHKPVLGGFGAAAFITFLVPGLNFLALPVLVTAGTSLALDLGTPDLETPEN
jgi:CysZ protein